MNAKRLFQDLENRDMDRRDFLKYAGLFALSVVGAKSAFELVMPPVEMANTQVAPAKQMAQKSGRGFGRSKYGV